MGILGEEEKKLDLLPSPRARSARTSASEADLDLVEASMYAALEVCWVCGPEKRFGSVYDIPFMFANSWSALMVSSSNTSFGSALPETAVSVGALCMACTVFEVSEPRRASRL